MYACVHMYEEVSVQYEEQGRVVVGTWMSLGKWAEAASWMSLKAGSSSVWEDGEFSLEWNKKITFKMD